MTYDELVATTELEAEESFYLQFCKAELYRKTLLLRVPPKVEIPETLRLKLAASCERDGYTLHVTQKWASVADLKAILGNICWLWPKWVPKEFVTVLAGDPGTGKSHLALNMCKTVTGGGKWPTSNIILAPSNVIYVDTEMRQVVTKERCETMGIDTSRVYIPNFGGNVLTQPDLTNIEHRRELENMVDELHPELIVLDSLGGAQAKENAGEDIKPTMLYLTKLVQDKRCACLVLHHLNKTNDRDSTAITLQRLRGSTAIAQFALSVMLVEKTPHGHKLWVEKLNAAKTPPPLRYEFEEEEVMVDGDPDTVVKGIEFSRWEDERTPTQLEEAQRWVIEVLIEAPGHELPASEIFERGNIETPYSKRLLKEAGYILEVKQGRIGRTRGKYSIWRLLQLDLPFPEELEDDDEDD